MLLARRVEQALGGELRLRSSSSAISAPRPAGSSSRRRSGSGAAGIGRDPAGGDDLQAVLGLEPHAADVPFQITASMLALSSLRAK